MHTKYLVIDDHAKCKEVKHIRKVMPDICIAVLPRALGIEAVRLRNAPRLVVPPYQMHAMWVSEF